MGPAQLTDRHSRRPERVNSRADFEPAAAVGWTRGDFAFLGGCLAVMVIFRIHAYAAPLEVDECNYAYIGERLLAGERLYVDVWDHQPPGMFALAAALIAVFGSGPLVFRIAATVAVSLTLLMIFGQCRGRVGRPQSWLAAALFAVVNCDPGMAGEGCNREIYMNLLGVGALSGLLSRRPWGLVLAGILLGVSSLLKTVVAGQWLALSIALGITAGRSSGRRVATQLLWFSLGPACLWVATVAYFRLTGRQDLFVEAAFTYNLSYGRIDVPAWQKFGSFFAEWSVFRSALPLWVAGGAGLLVLPWKRDFKFAVVIAAFAAGSMLAVCLPGRFWHHYYLLMLPVLVIGATAIFDRLKVSGGKHLDSTAEASGTRFPQGLPARAYGIALVLLTLGFQAVFYLRPSSDDVAAHRYGDRMAWARRHGALIGRVTAPGDYIYVCGIDTGMYYYSGRRCATRYTLVTALAGEDQAVVRRRTNFLEDLRAHRPRLICMVHNAPYVPELDQFIEETGYELVGADPARMDVLSDPARPVEAMRWDLSGTP